MIDIRSLVKRFGDFTAVDGVSFSVDRGEVLGFLGPNGAGKSTTMKMITGFLTPTSGTAIVCGADVLERPLEVKEHIGYLPEGAPAYPDMTPESFLIFCARVRGLRGDDRRKRIADVVDRVQLAGVMRQSIETLSKGFKRRVGLAQALLHDPDVLIMDEPTDGLDPNQKHEVRALIREMSPRKAIVLSTHILEEVESVCSRAIVIARGKIVADGTPGQLRAKSASHNAVIITVKLAAGTQGGAIKSELARLPGVSDVRDAEAMDGLASFEVRPRGATPVVAEVSELARSRSWKVDELRVDPGHLDDVFRQITAPPSLASREARAEKEVA